MSHTDELPALRRLRDALSNSASPFSLYEPPLRQALEYDHPSPGTPIDQLMAEIRAELGPERFDEFWRRYVLLRDQEDCCSPAAGALSGLLMDEASPEVTSRPLTPAELEELRGIAEQGVF